MARDLLTRVGKEGVMYSLRVVLLLASWGLVAAAVGVVGYDLQRAWVAWKRDPGVPLRRPRARAPARLLALAVLALLAHQSISIVPSGYAGVRVSQLSGTRPGTLYPGVHLVKPLLERVALYDTRDRVLATSAEGREGPGRPQGPVEGGPGPGPGRDGPLPAGAVSGSTTSTRTCRRRSSRSWCRRSWPASSASWCRATPCARCSPPGARRCATWRRR